MYIDCPDCKGDKGKKCRICRGKGEVRLVRVMACKYCGKTGGTLIKVGDDYAHQKRCI